MRTGSKFVLGVTGLSLIAYSFSAVAQKSGWQDLFDGKSLKGWKAVGGKAPYEVVDGAIVGTMADLKRNSFLITEKEYGDFILELEVKLEGTETNSGVQTRSHIDPAGNQGEGRVYGRQMEIDPSDRAWTGGIYDEGRRLWLYPLSLNPEATKAYKRDAYNHYRIEAIGNETRTWVNGVPASFVVDTLDPSGFIGLQVHAIKDAGLVGKKVYFRNIRIQTKNLKSKAFPKDLYVVNLTPNSLSPQEKAGGYQLLFDGASNNGWKSARANVSGFPAKGWEIKDGVITVLPSDGGESTNGGDIVTNEQFSAFDLSFEFKLTPGANSGVKYFVTLSEETKGSAIGLEYQILDDEKHPDAKHGKDGNRTLASLYDLITAQKEKRHLRPIGQWNRGRLVVYPDNRVEHYLNGVKVVEYVRGSEEFLRLVAGSKYKDWENFGQAKQGHILLQDHGDRVSFRSIKLKKL